MASRPRKNPRARPRAPGLRNRGVLLHLGLLTLLAAASYVLWVDHTVREAFEQHRWELPARVYARPLELYAGAGLTPAQVTSELDRLGYRQVPRPSGPGQYALHADTLRLRTRGFAFWDAEESARFVEVVFAGAQVVVLTDLSSQHPVPVLRLEPVEIARIYPRQQEDRVLVRLSDVPPSLIDALLAAEDRHYFEHAGIDPLGIARALYVNLKSGEIRQGGSTITQQLAKNFYLGRERTVWRKLNEVIMAVSLDRHYGKEQILEAYLNEIFLGQDGQRAIHGVGLAAQFYFGRPLNELPLNQLALLAGLVRGASYYDPRRYPERALERRNQVLAAMVESGKLDASAAAREQAAPLGTTLKPLFRDFRYPAFLDLVRQQLQRDYHDEDLRTEGLQIFTTLDPTAQSQTESAVTRQLEKLEGNRSRPPGSLQAAVVVADNHTGEVLALVGGRDPVYAGFNRAVDARRQVGSLLKPAVYLAALMHPDRYDVTTEIEDAPYTWRNGNTAWTPSNYDGTAHGRVSLHDALAHSYNLATVRLGLNVGIGEVRRRLQELGLDRDLPNYPSLFLGAVDLSPLEVAQMYQTIAGRGFRAPLRAIREVLTHDGKRLTHYGLAVQEALKPEPVFLLTYLLTKVTQEGTAAELTRTLGRDRIVAGKTGTTNDLRDSWFAGFGEDLMAVVWVGRDDNLPTELTGASGAMHIWSDLMVNLKPQPLMLDAPEGVEWRWVLADRGAVTDAQCPRSSPWPFIHGSGPEDYVPCNAAPTTLPEVIRGSAH